MINTSLRSISALPTRSASKEGALRQSDSYLNETFSRTRKSAI